MDVTIVCGRRPDLLSRTLESFQDNMFRHFEIGTVHANIDPFCGTEAEGDACEALLRSHFPRVAIRRPETPSFGMAVKHLWQQPQSRYFVHLEDDWELLGPVLPQDIEPRLQGKVMQVQLSKLDRYYLPKTYAFKTSWRSILGLKFIKRVHMDRPIFSTSPSFLVADFARTCAGMMDPGRDPEKQLYSGESPLTEFTSGYLNHPLMRPGRKAIVRDLGRPWLAERGITKDIIGGVAVWLPSTPKR